MTFAAHGFHHSESRQRIDEGRRPVLGRCPLGQDQTRGASTTRYCVYIAPPAMPTVFPSRACAADDDPAATTVPAPSLPTGSDLSIRAESPARAPAPNDAVTMGRSGVPATVAVVMSAPAMSSAQVRRVDRRGFHADQHLVGGGRGNGDVVQ